jgi:hypothetical protein
MTVPATTTWIWIAAALIRWSLSTLVELVQFRRERRFGQGVACWGRR